jgi:hypothetical protein
MCDADLYHDSYCVSIGSKNQSLDITRVGVTYSRVIEVVRLTTGRENPQILSVPLQPTAGYTLS